MPEAVTDAASENQAVIDFASRHLADLAEPVDVGVPDILIVRTPADWNEEMVDFGVWRDVPRRPMGEIVLHDPASFAAAVAHRRLEGVVPVVYADEAATTVTAVLNDDATAAAGWRDYRVRLGFRHTPEWTAWKAASGKFLAQEAFADHVEANLRWITEPEAAELLELLQRFQATVSARWESSVDLRSGHRVATYEETVKGTKTGGAVEIPTEIGLRLRPFIGAEPVEVAARIKVRAKDGALHLAYTLDQPVVVERDAFEAMVARLGAALGEGVVVLYGAAPPSR